MNVTIVIPMRNEEAYVGQCLDSVLMQVGERDDIEILCVDGASTDRTAKIVATQCDADSRVRLIDNPAKIVPVGMNLAIAQARGDVVIRLDCHAEYASDYIDKCIEVLNRTKADNVGGYMQTVPGTDTPIGRAIAAATSSPFGVGGSSFRTGGQEREVDTVPFGCFRRDVFDRFGPYDERLVRNQDIELNSRIRKGGGKIVISPEIRLKYFNRSTYSGIRQQAFNNGLWNPYTIYLIGGGLRVRHFIPLVFVVTVMALLVCGAFWRPAWFVLAGEMALYFGGAVLGAVGATRKAGTNVILVLLTFVQLHVSYGLGSLFGVLTAPLKFGLRCNSRQAGQALANRRQ